MFFMANPNRTPRQPVAQAREKRRFFFNLDIAAAEFAIVAALDLAAELLRHRHLAVADAEHGNARVEHRLRRAGRTLFHHARRTAGEDDGLRFVRGERAFRFLEWDNLAIDARFAHTACDQLGHLRAEIDHEDGGCHGGIYPWRGALSSTALPHLSPMHSAQEWP